VCARRGPAGAFSGWGLNLIAGLLSCVPRPGASQRTRFRPSQLFSGPEPERRRSRSAAPRTRAADPHTVVERSIKTRWRNESGDLFLDEAAESGCCFVAAACGYRLIADRKSRLGETGRTYGRRQINEAGIARPKQSSGRSGQSPRGTSREFAADNSVSRSRVRQRHPQRALRLRATISPRLEGWPDYSARRACHNLKTSVRCGTPRPHRT
jgi:hypothetical protein